MPAGQVTVSAVNRDSVPHDLVLLATDVPAERLPTTGSGLTRNSSELAVLARTSTLAPASSGSVTVTLAAGRYVLVCTVPHHYVREMMVATLVVV